MKSLGKYDFNIENAENIFFTSDTHFNHYNIIKSCGRPYKDEDEMNEAFIENWNAVTDKESVIFHLGDFAWGTYQKWKNV